MQTEWSNLPRNADFEDLWEVTHLLGPSLIVELVGHINRFFLKDICRLLEVKKPALLERTRLEGDGTVKERKWPIKRLCTICEKKKFPRKLFF